MSNTVDELKALCDTTATSAKREALNRCFEPIADHESHFIEDVERFAFSANADNAAARYSITRSIREQNCGIISNALSAAEHFDYVLSEVSVGGPTEFGIQLISNELYDDAKRLIPNPILRLINTGKCDSAPASDTEKKAGIDAALKGLSDYFMNHTSLKDRLDRGERIERIPVEKLDRQSRDFLEGRITA